MTLPSFKPITLGQVCVEFGAPGTTNLGAFVRGGAWVPDTSANSGVPTSKPITLGDLLGAEAYTYTAMTGSMADVNGDTHWPDAFSETANANISYGNPSKTYNWSKISGQTSYFTLSPSGSSCGISANRARYDTSNISMVLQCVVTDGTGSVTVTCTVTDNYL